MKKFRFSLETVLDYKQQVLDALQAEHGAILARVQAQAQQILTHARAEAEHAQEEILRSSQRELRRLAAEATKRLALHKDPFDQFLDLAEEEASHEER